MEELICSNLGELVVRKDGASGETVDIFQAKEAAWTRGFTRQDGGGIFGECSWFGTTSVPHTSVSLLPAQDKDSIQRVLQAVDKANGYCFGVQEQRSLEAMMSAAMGADFHFSSYPSSLASMEASFLLTSGLTGGWCLRRLQCCLYLSIREDIDQKEQQIQRPSHERALVTRERHRNFSLPGVLNVKEKGRCSGQGKWAVVECGLWSVGGRWEPASYP